MVGWASPTIDTRFILVGNAHPTLMPQPPNDSALSFFAAGMLLLSITACMNLVSMRRRGLLLPYEPRRPVPWGAIGCILAVMYLLTTAYSVLGGEGDGATGGSPHSLAPSTLVAAMLQQLFIVGGVLFVIALFTKATLRDLGVAANKGQRVRDVCVGAAACLAALAPVHITQMLLMCAFFPEQMQSGHPLIKMVMSAPPEPGILLLTGVAAVVVAPICEEITFRLLLQGWLERWEDERLGWRAKTIEMPNVVSLDSDDQSLLTGNDSNQTNLVTIDIDQPSLDAVPPRRGIAGLSYGWFPIAISSTLFGIAHYGYGPEPVPLFLLGLALGYLYQRTHRIIPGIVAHALFNLFTMVMLWRMVYHHG
jgi:membrane protease YdiL (CAAX protease family)